MKYSVVIPLYNKQQYANMIYKLWHENKLDYWCIHGTMKTNMNAIEAFLERFRNTETPVME